MIIDIDNDDYEINKEYCIALGNFDGLHIGHQSVIKDLKDMAEEKNLTPSILLFKEHTKVLLEKHPFKTLTSIDDKIEILQDLGIHDIFKVKFESIRDYSPEYFLDYLKNELNVRGIIVGSDYRFGKFAKGNVELMRDYCERNNIYLEVLEQVQADKNPIKSTYIRQLIEEGKVSEAKELLGRPFKIRGIVEHGFKRGRALGFPTANLSQIGNYVLPKEGVYLSKTYLKGEEKPYYGLSFVGRNVTFNEEDLKVENYIFDFEKDLYNEEIQIEFLEFIRENKKFEDKFALIEQIDKDIEIGRKLIEN